MKKSGTLLSGLPTSELRDSPPIIGPSADIVINTAYRGLQVQATDSKLVKTHVMGELVADRTGDLIA